MDNQLPKKAKSDGQNYTLYLNRVRIAVESLIVSALLAACASTEQATQTPPPAPAPAPVSAPPPKQAPASPPKPVVPAETLLKDAEDKATSAKTLEQTAVSKDDWNLIISRWEESIKMLKEIPASSPEAATAKKRIAEYQNQLTQAQKKGDKPTTKEPVVRVKSSTEPDKNSKPENPAKTEEPKSPSAGETKEKTDKTNPEKNPPTKTEPTPTNATPNPPAKPSTP